VQTFGRYRWLREYSAAHTWSDSVSVPPERLTDGIRFDHVDFAYPSAEAAEETSPKLALRDVDLHLPAGTTVAFVGENGAGKSTLVKLLARLYDPTRGAVLIDGVPLSELDPALWRERMSAGFQDFASLEFLATDSIGVGDLANRDDADRLGASIAAGQAGPVIESLDDGLETQLGTRFEGGVGLSGGQWQRLALARAFMRRRPLLMLLDEPTAALDPEAEQAIYQQYGDAARELAKTTGAVTVLVSHRFSTVRMADLIVVVADGRISEFGTHADLLRAGGRYAELFELQARAYR
jgi:ATP-binding cassette subfamily B protein